jgi:transposase
MGSKKRPLKHILLKLYRDPNITNKDIAEKFSVSAKTVYNWLDYYEIERNHPTADFTPSLIQQIIIEYIQLQSLQSIAKRHHTSTERVKKALLDAGVVIPSHTDKPKIQTHATRKYWVPIPDKLLEILNGLLLGDGYLRSETSHKSHWDDSLSNYINALNIFHNLQTSSELDMTTAVEKYNKAVEVISRSQIAFIGLHTALIAEPWVRYIAQQFHASGHQVNLPPPVDSVFFESQRTVQLYKHLYQWYRNRTKIVPRNLRLTPRTVLHWFIGDASPRTNRITLCTQSFSKEDNEFLADLLKKQVGIIARVCPDRTYWMLEITGSDNIEKFYEYLEAAPKEALSLAKQLFSWKFDFSLKKEDVYNYRRQFVDEEWLQRFLDLLEQVGVILLDRAEQLYQLFPWRFSLEFPKEDSVSSKAF